VFQSLQGLILTIPFTIENGTNVMFQSLQGLILTAVITIMIIPHIMFQSLQGLILTLPFIEPIVGDHGVSIPPRADFNPLK